MSRRAYIYVFVAFILGLGVHAHEAKERDAAIRGATEAALYQSAFYACARDMEDHDYLTYERCEKIGRDIVRAYSVRALP